MSPVASLEQFKADPVMPKSRHPRAKLAGRLSHRPFSRFPLSPVCSSANSKCHAALRFIGRS